MNKEFVEALEKLLEDADLKAEIKLKTDGDKLNIEMDGSLPVLFYGACEIVKILAIRDGKERPGREREYVKFLCETVLEDLERGE